MIESTKNTTDGDIVPAVYSVDKWKEASMLCFKVQWNTSTSGKQQFQVESELGAFDFFIHDYDDKYSFSMKTTKTDYPMLKDLKWCIVCAPKAEKLLNEHVIYKYFGNYIIDGSIRKQELEAQDDERFQLEFQLNSHKPKSNDSEERLERSLASAMMERLFLEDSGNDVFFVFHGAEDTQEQEAAQLASPAASEKEHDPAGDSAKEKESSEHQDQSKDAEIDIDKGKQASNGVTTDGPKKEKENSGMDFDQEENEMTGTDVDSQEGTDPVQVNQEKTRFAEQDSEKTDASQKGKDETDTVQEESHGGRASDKDIEKKDRIIGARMFVLLQWSHFWSKIEDQRVMKCGKGKKEVWIKDVNEDTFKLMLFFMYTGILDQTDAALLEQDGSDVALCDRPPTWESLYMAAHQYRIDDLRRLACTIILDNMTWLKAVAFLFRTGYRFQELREPMIKFVVEHCCAVISKKEIRNRYKNHPEFGELMGELLEARYDLYR